MARGGLLTVGVAMLAVLLLGVPATATPPPAPATTPWVATDMGTLEREVCVEWFGLARCARSGGLAAQGSTNLVVYVQHLESEFGDPDYAVRQRTINGGGTWSFPNAFVTGMEAPPSTWYPALAQRGSDLAVIFQKPADDRSIQVRTSDDMGASWVLATRSRQPGMVVTNLAIARGPGGRIAYAVAAYDEVPGSGPDAGVQVRVSTDGGDTFPRTRFFGWDEGYCWATGTDPSIAITQGGVIVVAYWRTCSQLVVRRSTDDGRTWSAPRTLSSGPHVMGMAIAAHRDGVVLAYTADGEVRTRFSGNRGRTWSAPAAAGSSATSLRIVYAGGAWRLLAGGTDRIRYRTSSNGRGWSAGETVAESIGARTYALGVAYGTEPVVAYVIRTPDKTYRLYVARQ